jgi:hypothetical protein
MQEIYVGQGVASGVNTVPLTATQVSITHELGDVLVDHEPAVGTFPFTPDSIGIHKFEWWNISGDLVKREFASSVIKLVQSDVFYDEHPDLAGTEDSFDRIERIVRGRINSFTGQEFGPLVNKAIVVQGDGGSSLALPLRVISITSITNSYQDDITDLVEIAPGSDMIVQKSTLFRGGTNVDIKRDLFWDTWDMFSDKYNFTIVGDFGWEFVPNDVVDAASILIEEQLAGGDISNMKQQGVRSASLGDFSVTFGATAATDGTGNSMADSLLGEYVLTGIGLI